MGDILSFEQWAIMIEQYKVLDRYGLIGMEMSKDIWSSWQSDRIVLITRIEALEKEVEQLKLSKGEK